MITIPLSIDVPLEYINPIINWCNGEENPVGISIKKAIKEHLQKCIHEKSSYFEIKRFKINGHDVDSIIQVDVDGKEIVNVK